MSKPDFSLDLVISELPGVPEKQLKGMEKLGLETIRDLVHHYPRRYEDRRQFDEWPMGPTGLPVCIHGQLTDAMVRRFGSGRNSGYFEATLEPLEALALAGPIYLRWFNMPFMKKVLAAGMEIVVFGQPKITGGKLTIAHPDYEIIEHTGDVEIHMYRITPVYPGSSGLTQRFLRSWAYRAMRRLEGVEVETVLPSESLEAILHGFTPPNRYWALRQIHFPDSFREMKMAREYLALEEFVAIQIEVLRRKRDMEKQAGESHVTTGELLKDFLEMLPFELTGAQLRCIDEAREDMASTKPMNRLLQGDVGSGKTMVAFAAMLLAVEAGFQAAIMAPTQILAEQHFLGFQKFAEKLDLRISLRTGSRADDNFAGGMFGDDDAQIVVGTHALIHGKVKFSKLGLVVIDEQHKFGVSQRGALADQGVNPDILVMTATPIPRTLTMTVYGDLDVSIIDEYPSNRGKVITGVRPSNKSQQVTSFIKQQLDEGRQAYIVYPLVEESEKLKSASAIKEFEVWQKRLKKYEVGLLHGKIHGDEKEQVMSDFREHKTDVLVATTVIEVGVDVPNSNIIVIYNAERFGLAQIHQLRGRVGRGEHKSYCILMVDPKNEEAMERLKIMEETRDGFRIAEEDLKIRGPGDVLGTQQSGLPDLTFAAELTNVELVQKARDVAAHVLEIDPDLSEPEHWPLRQLVQRMSREPAQMS